MWILCAHQRWAVGSDTLDSDLTVFRFRSLGIVRGVNTDYHHGDCLLRAQMGCGSLEYELLGRIRGWDGLIILLRKPVSRLPPLSRRLVCTPFFTFGVGIFSFSFTSRRLSSWIL